MREPAGGSEASDEVGGALVEAADGARLLVVGSRGGRAGLLAGEIADRIASDATCAVAVARGPGDGR